jgi:Arc/MetJ-type ribon-helix-helix transcriptional regulator
MKPLTVQLPEELAGFVEQAVADGLFESADDLFAYAVGLVRTESVLGHRLTPATPAPAQSGSGTVAPPVPRHGTPPAVPLVPVDLTRQPFDSPNFMATLVGKLEQKRAEDLQQQRQPVAKPPQ